MPSCFAFLPLDGPAHDFEIGRSTYISLTVNLYYTGVDGNAKKFAEEMERSGITAKIRAENGNLRYEYFFRINDGETVLLIDSWADQAALDAHHASQMMKELATLREKYDLHMRAERYLSDEEGVPFKEAPFIRR